MLILMKRDATEQEINDVMQTIKENKLTPHKIPGKSRVAIGITGNETAIDPAPYKFLPGVFDAISVSKPYKLVSREVKPEGTEIIFKNAKISEDIFTIIAGPCAIESKSQIMELSEVVKKAGVKFLRGGAFKPRTSPYSFQGLKEEGLKYLKEACEKYKLYSVTEVKEKESLKLVCDYADILQIGARNMQNFGLLEEVGKVKKPVFLKRGMSATIVELLMAAEYIMSNGNHNIILCERGIRTFETMTRNTLDLGAVCVLKKETHLPIIVDPSHAFGFWYGVAPLAKASLACGADGVMIEIHGEPNKAKSDGQQSLIPEKFIKLVLELKEIAKVLGREI